MAKKKNTHDVRPPQKKAPKSSSVFASLKKSKFYGVKALVFILVFASVGGYFLWHSFAASNTTYTQTACINSGGGTHKFYKNGGCLTMDLLNGYTTAPSFMWCADSGNANAWVNDGACSQTMVAQQKNYVNSISASPGSINIGSSVTVSWSALNGSTCTAVGGNWSGGLTTTQGQGSKVVGPFNTPGTVKFTIQCGDTQGSDQLTSNNVTVTDPNSGGGGGTTTATLTPATTTIIAGQSATLTWSSNASSCSTVAAPATPLNWTKKTTKTGSDVVTPPSTTTYKIKCGSATSAAAVVTVLPYLTLSADSNSITKGQATKVNWTVKGAASCTASGSWGTGAKDATDGNHSESVSPDSTATYGLVCANALGGKSTPLVTTVTVNGVPAKPTADIAAKPSSIAYNAVTYLQWNSANAVSCDAAWTSSHATSGTIQTGRLTKTTTYQITCKTAAGVVSSPASATVTVGKAPTGCPPNCPTPVAPPAPIADIAPPVTEDTSDDTDQVVAPAPVAVKKPPVKKQNHLRNLLLGGLLGELIGLAKHGH